MKTTTTMISISTIVPLAVATVAGIFDVKGVQAFLPPTRITNVISSNNHATSTSLFMGKKKKPSMKERRKQRAKKQPGYEVDRGLLNDMPPVDAWEKTTPSVGRRPALEESESAAPSDSKETVGDDSDEFKETAAKASALVATQRKSVDTLTFIRKRVEGNFPMNDAVKAIADKGYFVYDGFLSSGDDQTFGDTLLLEMFEESSGMLANDKLERDITRLGDGEYVAKIIGGEAYADCPRLTEYVVSLTRHLPPLLNTELDALEAAGNVSKINPTASMGTLRVYDRKTQQGEEALLVKPETDDDGDNDAQGRPYGVVCGDEEGTDNDTRRITAMLYLSSKDWNASVNGGGVTIENGESVEAIRDRLILIRSDTCSHRQEPWKGDDTAGLEQASLAVVHFVKEGA